MHTARMNEHSHSYSYSYCKRTDLQITSFQYFIPSIHPYAERCKVHKWNRARAFNGMIWRKIILPRFKFYNQKIGENTKNRLACRHNGDDRLSLLPTDKAKTKNDEIFTHRNIEHAFVRKHPTCLFPVHWTRFPINYSQQLQSAIFATFRIHMTIIFVFGFAFISSDIGCNNKSISLSFTLSRIETMQFLLFNLNSKWIIHLEMIENIAVIVITEILWVYLLLLLIGLLFYCVFPGYWVYSIA